MRDLMAGNEAQVPQTVLNMAISVTSDAMGLPIPTVSGADMAKLSTPVAAADAIFGPINPGNGGGVA